MEHHESVWCAQVQEDGRRLCSQFRNTIHDYHVFRPGRLTDGPYTSYDLNTLLKATTGERRAVVIGKGDKLVGEVSRLVVAEACIQALDIESTEGQIYEINSMKLQACRYYPE
ncbi:uncharacterized protein [Zea mays]|uniref:uncharacterized protein isoform X2 n=1 Tax=Zea mays TaxID=4577 RepID=UPI0009A94BCE|nr:uncharacterized protein LOC103651883 isoform X2 [Zea mays]|eukprot:XP_020406277.1 uncharacterized protein LOC103651883 isoform X2 [Zea mays]